jgi:hypothetical protein
MKTSEVVLYVIAMLLAASLLAGIGLFARGCQERDRECSQKAYEECRKSGGSECALSASKVCRGSR